MVVILLSDLIFSAGCRLFLVIAACHALSIHCGIAQQPVCQVVRMCVGEHWQNQVAAYPDSVPIRYYVGNLPVFKPVAYAKLGYDDTYIYLYFHVRDKHVVSRTTAYNGPVSRDACVEFFFSPNENQPLHYFNLEINAGGTPLMRYNAGSQRTLLAIEDLKTIVIAHSLPGVIEQAIEETVIWTIACKIPLRTLERYATITHPKKGVEWRANFYKTASQGPNPHWITWAPVESEVPNFHLPQYFGRLVFD